jgi:hypothetical protein
MTSVHELKVQGGMTAAIVDPTGRAPSVLIGRFRPGAPEHRRHA